MSWGMHLPRNAARKTFTMAVMALGLIAPATAQPPAQREQLPEVWVGNRRVEMPHHSGRRGAATTMPAAVNTWNSTASPPMRSTSIPPLDPPPKLKLMPPVLLDPPPPPPKANVIHEKTPPAKPQISKEPEEVTPIHHTSAVMPASVQLPVVPEANSVVINQPSPHSDSGQDSSNQPRNNRERPRLVENPTAESHDSPSKGIEHARQAESTTVITLPAEKPMYVNVMAQMLSVLAALTIFCAVVLAVHFVLARKYGVSLLAPFRVEVVATGPPMPPMPEWTPPPLKELTALKRVENDEPPVEPNFEMPPTYEEEMALREAAEAQREEGVLQFIADMNHQLQMELQRLATEEAKAA